MFWHVLVELSSEKKLDGFLEFKIQNPDLCKIIHPKNGIEINLNKENNFSVSLNLTLYAKKLGFTNLDVYLDEKNVGTISSLTILTDETRAVIAKILSISLIFFNCFIAFMMGTQLSIQALYSIVKQPVGPIVGFCSQFILMPMIAYCLIITFLPSNNRTDDIIRFTFFVCGCCPNGGKSSFWTIIFGGNLNMSVAMTITQNIGALFMMPLWIYTLGKNVYNDDSIRIPFLDIIRIICYLIIPALFGMLFIHFYNHLEKQIQLYMKKVCWIITAILMSVVLYLYWDTLYYFSWPVIICACFHPWIGYAMSYFAAWITKREHKDCITISIETGTQNMGIAILLAMECWGEPTYNIAAVMPIALFLTTDKPLLLGWFIMRIKKNLSKNKKKENLGEINKGFQSSTESSTATIL
uniref:Sodium/bile acid cotransporter n=2 Tax=Panagrolaimus sp. JU765 TaxID=591449 RepID=A0AC34QQA4_9BILA